MARPVRVDVLSEENIVAIKAQGDTSGALTADGRLFLWGDNGGGKASSGCGLFRQQLLHCSTISVCLVAFALPDSGGG